MTASASLYQQLLTCTQQFEALLEEELALLTSDREPDLLSELAEKKMDCVQNLDYLDRQRPAQDDNSPIDSNWQTCLGVLARCKVLNEKIGAHLQRQTEYNARALEILGLAEPQVRTYAPDGLAAEYGGGRSIGKA